LKNSKFFQHPIRLRIGKELVPGQKKDFGGGTSSEEHLRIKSILFSPHYHHPLHSRNVIYLHFHLKHKRIRFHLGDSNPNVCPSNFEEKWHTGTSVLAEDS
jgi:hypothetical protein